MDYTPFASQLLKLRDKDLACRDRLIQEGTLGDGYNSAMEAVHIENATTLLQIIDTIGYPTRNKVGTEASEAAWLIIQHAISLPACMRSCAKHLQGAVEANEADPKQLAYLTDRIAVLEGKPQHYGTQFDWDSDGTMSPNPCDDLLKVAARRKAIGLNTLEEQTHIMRERVTQERQTAPLNLEKRKMELDTWRRKKGWIT